MKWLSALEKVARPLKTTRSSINFKAKGNEQPKKKKKSNKIKQKQVG